MISGSVLEFSVKDGNVHVQALKKSGDAAKGYAKSLGVLNKKQNITFRNSRNLHKANMKLMGSFSVLRSKLLLVGFATTMFTKTIGRLIAASNEQELAEKKLSQALISTGRSTEFSKHEMINFASALQKTTAFGDETIIKAQALLTTFTSIGKDVFPGATKAILNVSAAMGQDLQQTTIQVGKALNDPVQGMAALRRVGIQLSDAQEKQIKRFVGLNQVSNAQKIILGELQTQFGGMAKAVSETSAGALMQMKNAVGDAAEALGGLLAPAVIAFAKGIKFAAEGISGLINKFQQLRNEQTLVKMLTQSEAELESFKKSVEKMDIHKLTLLGRSLSKQLPPNSIYATLPDNLKLVADKALIVGDRLKELKENYLSLTDDLGAQDFDDFIKKQQETADAMIVEEEMLKQLKIQYPKLAEALGLFSEEKKEAIRLAKEEKEASEKLMAVMKKTREEFYESLDEMRMSDFEEGVKDLDRKIELFKKAGLSTIEIQEYVNARMAELSQEEIDNERKKFEERNILYNSFLAGYDEFVNTMIDKDLSAEERKQRILLATRDFFVRMLGEMIKEKIKQIVLEAVIDKAAKAEQLATVKAMSVAVGSAWATPALLSAVATGSTSVASALTSLAAGTVTAKAMAAGVTLAEHGYDGVVNRPTLFLTGEKNKPEHVKVTPLGGGSGNSTATTNINLSISGGIVQEDYIRNELLPAINKVTSFN